MVSSVGSRPNHYQMLGLSPAAGEDEIKQAFTMKMGLFGAHPLGEAAQLCIAYETLRNPSKRRDYDRSLGLTPVPEGRQWGFGMAQKRWRPFIAAGPIDRLAQEPPPTPQAEPHVTDEARGAPEPRVASFIAASLRELARPMAPEEAANPAPERRQECRSDPWLEPGIQEILSVRPIEQDSFASVEEQRNFDLKRPALAVGGFVLAAGLVGAVSGLSLRDDVESASASAEPAVTVAVPAAKQASRAVPSGPVGTSNAKADQPVEAYAYAPRSKHSASRQRPSSWAQQQVEENQPVPNVAVEPQPAEVASNDLAADPLAPKPVEASMPLPNKVIARTIERIGYSCGEVSSMSAIEGASGTYNVTCSSGQTYQAKPVHGRYHFRRSGGR
jgi:hypothetical protein